MRLWRAILVLFLVAGLSACAAKKEKPYTGPEVTAIQVQKANRKMYLLHGNEVLKEYDIALGKNPIGHKQYEGDGRTPEGTYFISMKNPKSQYHLSLLISYPNQKDRENAARLGKHPGGDIYIHGGPLRPTNVKDWTAGCIAVTDEQMDEIYPMIRKGTWVYILP